MSHFIWILLSTGLILWCFGSAIRNWTIKDTFILPLYSAFLCSSQNSSMIAYLGTYQKMHVVLLNEFEWEPFEGQHISVRSLPIHNRRKAKQYVGQRKLFQQSNQVLTLHVLWLFSPSWSIFIISTTLFVSQRPHFSPSCFLSIPFLSLLFSFYRHFYFSFLKKVWKLQHCHILQNRPEE